MSQICVITIYVPNMLEAIEFYTAILGFKVNKQYAPNIVSLVHGDLPIVLEQTEKAFNQDEKNSSGVVLGLRTEDIDKTLNFLKETKVDLIIDTPMDCPPGKFISFRDPFGNLFEFLQFNH